jgi:hypothetical protein
MNVALALQTAIQLYPLTKQAVTDLLNLLHGGANGTDPAPEQIVEEINKTNLLLEQARQDARA